MSYQPQPDLSSIYETELFNPETSTKLKLKEILSSTNKNDYIIIHFFRRFG